jgi:hypothetical protein
VRHFRGFGAIKPMWLTPGKPPFYPLDHAHLFWPESLVVFSGYWRAGRSIGLRFFVGQAWPGAPYQGVERYSKGTAQ